VDEEKRAEMAALTAVFQKLNAIEPVAALDQYIVKARSLISEQFGDQLTDFTDADAAALCAVAVEFFKVARRVLALAEGVHEPVEVPK